MKILPPPKRVLFLFVALILTGFGGTVAAVDGTVDTAFGPAVGPALCYPVAAEVRDTRSTVSVARYNDGRILVCGEANPIAEAGTGYDLYVMRRNADGSPDATFGSNGTVIVSCAAPSTSTDIPRVVAVQSLSENDDRVLVGGKSICSDSGFFSGFVLRLNSDGSLDDGGAGDLTPLDSFGTNGTGIVAFDRESANDGNSDAIFDIAVAEDGVIGVCGNSDVPGEYREEALVGLLSSNGVPVASFDGDGVAYVATTNKSGAFEFFSAVCFDTEGNLVLGSGRSDRGDAFRVVKMDRTGGFLAEFDGNSGDGDGIVDIVPSTGIVADVAVDGDDILVFGAIGETATNAGDRFAFCCLDSGNGRLNTNFNGTGIATVEYADRKVRGSCMAIDSSNRLWGSGQTISGGRYYPAVACVTRDGQIDGSFGYGGALSGGDRLAPGGFDEGMAGVALVAEPGGRMTAVAPFMEGDSLYRYAHDGFLDASIVGITRNSEGYVTERVSFGSDTAVGIDEHPDGGFVVVGNVNDDRLIDQSDGIVIGRYMADGMPEIGFPAVKEWDRFDMMGKRRLSLSKTFETGERNERLTGMAVDSVGRTLMCGLFWTSRSPVTNFSSVCRVTADGELDTSFAAGDGDGHDGVALIDAAVLGEATQEFIDIAVLPDDGCVVVGNGFMNTDGYFDVVVAKFDGNGMPDPSFGTNGIAWFAWADGQSTSAAAVTPDDAGRVVVVCETEGRIVLLRFLSDGTLDPSFGAGDGDGRDGAVRVSAGSPWEYLPRALNLQRCGGEERIIVSGTGGSTSPSFAMRFRGDGTLDTTFGSSDGILQWGAESEDGRACLLQPDGKPVVVGGDTDISISRGTWDGRADPSFGGNGTGTCVTGTDWDDTMARAVITGGGERIVAAGTTGKSMALWGFRSTPVASVGAGFGRALRFDGTDDYAVIEGTNSLWFTGTNTYTITLWARPETNGCLYRLDGVIGAYRDYISVGADGRVTFAVAKGGSMADKAESVASIPWDRWSHIACVRDATNTVLYIDGRVRATAALKAATLSAPLSATNLYLGVKGDSMVQYFKGDLDEICLFREALPQSTIAAWAFRRPDHSHPAVSARVLELDCDVVTNGVTPNLVDGNVVAELHNMGGEAHVTSRMPTTFSVVGSPCSGRLVGHDLLGSSDNGIDWNMTFQVVSNGALGTVTVVDSNRFLFTPFSEATGTNRFTYRCINRDGVTSEVVSASVVVPVDFDDDGIDDLWELDYGLSPTNGLDASETWDADPYNNLQEFVADTDPDDSNSYFRIVSVLNNPNIAVTFLSSSNRIYRMIGCSNLSVGGWTDIPGAGPRAGMGGPDVMADTNNPSRGPFYRLSVEVPSN